MADLNNELDLNVPAAPSLTLDAAPTLTLDPAADEKVIAESKKATPVQVEDTPLSPEERKMVNDFAEKIDITNSQMVLQYGAASQKKLSDFSETALSRVKTKDMGETGELITSLISELQGFDATTEQMRDNPDLYHADTNTYYALAGPGVGERPLIGIQSFEQEGNLVNIDLLLKNEAEQHRRMMLTIRLTDDGYRYVSYLPQSVNRTITDHLLEEIILKFGAEVTRSDHVYHSTGTGMFLSPSWTVEEMTPGSFNGWYLDYSNYIYTYGERLTIFASPLGENTGWFYPADLYEAAAKAYFGLSAEELRAGEDYNAEYGGYFSPRPVGRGYTPLITLEDYDQQYDLLTLNVSVSQLEAPDRKMTLTVRLTEDGYQYLSYLPR